MLTTIAIIGEETDEVRELSDWASGEAHASTRISLHSSNDPTVVQVAAVCFVDAARHPVLAVGVCARVRAVNPDVPIIVISDSDAEVELAALSAGATIVLGRPISRIRLRAYAERFLRPPSFPISRAGEVQLGEHVVLDLAARRLVVAGQERPLTVMKYELLCYFLSNRGRAVPAEELIQQGLLQRSQAARYRGIVLELRRSLGPAGKFFISVPGHGYRLDVEWSVAQTCSNRLRTPFNRRIE